jgi:phosphate transport system protein
VVGPTRLDKGSWSGQPHSTRGPAPFNPYSISSVPLHDSWRVGCRSPLVSAERCVTVGDLQLAESVIADDVKVDDLQRDLEDRAITVLARQQPVATDLRTVVTSLRMSADLERSGDLAQHVAKLARLRYPERAVPGDLHRTILEMGQLAQRLMAQAAEVIITQDVEAAVQLEQDDDRMDELHRMIFQHLMDDRWKHGVETAVDVTLVGRYYERFADHAVSVARRLVYLVTGEHADDYMPDVPIAP